MSNIKLFEDKKVRTIWNEADEKWYFGHNGRGANPYGHHKSLRLSKKDQKARRSTFRRVGTNCHPPFNGDCGRQTELELLQC